MTREMPLLSIKQIIVSGTIEERRSAAFRFRDNPDLNSVHEVISALGEIYAQAAIDDYEGHFNSVKERIEFGDPADDVHSVFEGGKALASDSESRQVFMRNSWRYQTLLGLDEILPRVPTDWIAELNRVLYRMAKLDPRVEVARFAVVLLGITEVETSTLRILEDGFKIPKILNLCDLADRPDYRARNNACFSERIRNLCDLAVHSNLQVRGEALESLKKVGLREQESTKRLEVVEALLALRELRLADVVQALDELSMVDREFQNIVARAVVSASPFVAEESLLERLEGLKMQGVAGLSRRLKLFYLERWPEPQVQYTKWPDGTTWTSGEHRVSAWHDVLDAINPRDHEYLNMRVYLMNSLSRVVISSDSTHAYDLAPWTEQLLVDQLRELGYELPEDHLWLQRERLKTASIALRLESGDWVARRSAAHEFAENPDIRSAREVIVTLGKIYSQAAVDDLQNPNWGPDYDEFVLEVEKDDNAFWRYETLHGLEKMLPQIPSSEIPELNRVLYRIAKLDPGQEEESNEGYIWRINHVPCLATELLGKTGCNSSEKINNLRDLGDHSEYQIRHAAVESLKQMALQQLDSATRNEIVAAMLAIGKTDGAVYLTLFPALETLANVDTEFLLVVTKAAHAAVPFIGDKKLLERLDVLKAAL